MANNIASSNSLAANASELTANTSELTDNASELTANASELTPIAVKNLCEKIARKLGVDELYLFGSVARNAANRNSDVDFIYQFHNDSNLQSPQSTIEEARKKQELRLALSECLGRKVDLVNKDYVTKPLCDDGDLELQRKAFITAINKQPIYKII